MVKYYIYGPWIGAGSEQMVGTVTAKSKTEAKKKFRDKITCKKSRSSPGFYECSTEFMGKKIDLGFDLIKAKTVKEAKDKALRYRVRVSI